ncbi:MAG: OmpA family protein [Flavisolibacter sp.]
MAEINVQPKKRKGSFLPWLLLLLGIIALCIFLFRNKGTKDTTDRDRTSYNNTSTNAAAASGWTAINWSAASVNYEEVSNREIEVRSGDNYSVYGLGENVLFDKDESTLKPGAEYNLKQVVSSIDKRYKGGDVGLFGFTDATGSKDHNKQLSQQRAETVRAWLVQHGIDDKHISIQAKGENSPVASNNTEKGKEQNRRVEIVARKS